MAHSYNGTPCLRCKREKVLYSLTKNNIRDVCENKIKLRDRLQRVHICAKKKVYRFVDI